MVTSGTSNSRSTFSLAGFSCEFSRAGAAQGSDDYDESDANEEDEEDHSWEHGESGCAALNVMLDGIHVLGLPYHMLRL